MTLKAVFFGSIGSFSETSRLQLDSFNESMKINRIDEIWDEKEYREYLEISGGVNRLKSILSKQLNENIIFKIHYDKTKIFQQKIFKSRSLIRPGFEELCKELLANNILLGLASTTSLQTIESILLGLESIEISDFSFIAHSGTVNKQKPDPQVYKICLEELNVQEFESVSFEDTTSSLNSVLSAGIKGIAIPGNLSKDQDFSMAQLKLNEFSDIDFKGLTELL